MRRRIVQVVLILVALVAVPCVASAQTCVTIDEAYDALTADERRAAVLLVKKQFELAGHRAADTACAATYTLSHLRLGNTIVVSLTGPLGTREGKALGVDDLPAVYSQMVRSLITGHPMGSLSVLDRSNVSAAQDEPPRRLRSDGFWHARVGQATVFGPTARHGASFGFGYRAEFDRIGVDVSFFNLQTSGSGSYRSAGGSALTLIKLEGLYFLSPTSNRSAYFGGGLSYGRTDLRSSETDDYVQTTGRGAGLQAELTAGYELARVTSVRMFVQGDVTLPLYQVEFERFSYPRPVGGVYVPPTVTVESHYAPTLTVSLGLGWGRARR